MAPVGLRRGSEDQAARSADAMLAFHVARGQWRTSLLLLCSDILAVVVAGGLTVWGRYLLGGRYTPELYWNLWPILGLFVLVYASLGLYSGVALYPGVALGPVEELRRATMGTTTVYLLLGMATFLMRGAEIYSRSVFLVAWALTIAAIPLGRAMVRRIWARCPWWGNPTVILGAGKTGHMLVRVLQRHPGLGLKPVALLDDDPTTWGEASDVPVLGGLDLAPRLAKEFRIPYAIIAMPGVPGDQLLELYTRYGDSFPHLLVIPGLLGFSSLWVVAKDLGGVLGLEVRQRLLLRGPQLTKRALDLALTIAMGLVLLPLILLIAILIRVGSRGAAFYGHERLGHEGRRFRAWKFRTMVDDADKVLRNYLDRHPELREEWDRSHKLKKDPRVTWIGKWLRRSSLDELPQLWNILRGEMSLVGPRPIIEKEISRYGDKYELYQKVVPGLTGLWQVSGRNNLPYEERVELDTYYVRNWSVWFDIYILARTVAAVLRCDGAY